MVNRRASVGSSEESNNFEMLVSLPSWDTFCCPISPCIAATLRPTKGENTVQPHYNESHYSAVFDIHGHIVAPERVILEYAYCK